MHDYDEREARAVEFERRCAGDAKILGTPSFPPQLTHTEHVDLNDPTVTEIGSQDVNLQEQAQPNDGANGLGGSEA